jgi:hypothetical protein
MASLTRVQRWINRGWGSLIARATVGANQAPEARRHCMRLLGAVTSGLPVAEDTVRVTSRGVRSVVQAGGRRGIERHNASAAVVLAGVSIHRGTTACT